MDNGQIIIFQTQGGGTKIEIRFTNESVWPTKCRNCFSSNFYIMQHFYEQDVDTVFH